MVKEAFAVAVGILAAFAFRIADAGCNDKSPEYEGNDDHPDNYPAFSFPSEGCLPAIPISDLDFPKKVTYEGKTVEYAIDYPGGQDGEFKNLCEEMWACNQYFTQYADDDGGKDSLCFGTLAGSPCLYPLAPSEQRAKHDARKRFVVENCYGGGAFGRPIKDPIAYPSVTCDSTKQDCSGDTPSLEEVRNDLCAKAEEVSLRKTFVPVDKDACDNIIDCVLVVAELGPDGLSNEDKERLKYDLCQDTDEDGDLENEKTRYCGTEESESSCGGDYEIHQGTAPSCGVDGNPALPTCPERYNETFADFGPGYPNGPGYDVAVASIQGTFIKCPQDRTNSNAYGIVLTVKFAIETSLVIVNNIKDGLPDSSFNAAAYIVAALETILIALDAVLAQADYHDGGIDGAEIEAFYENTLQLLDGSSAIYDEVVCRCAEEKRRGHGCDSIDNDCDQTVDECDEDDFAPEIDIGQALCQCGSGTGCGEGQKWYLNDNDPEACVSSSTIAADDCDPNLKVNTTLFGTCFDSYVQIETKDRCNNTAETKTVGVWIDKEDPQPMCHFGNNSTKKILVLDDSGQGLQKNVDLRYDAKDNCGGDLKVSVEVYANEIEDFQSQEMALLYTTQDDADEKAGLYVATTICQTLSNGQCVQDPNAAKVGDINKDFRIYTVVVTAEDPSGRTEKDECKIVIAPQTWSTPDVPEDLDTSTQRFLLTSHESMFTGNTTHYEEVPDIPTPLIETPPHGNAVGHKQKAKFDK